MVEQYEPQPGARQNGREEDAHQLGFSWCIVWVWIGDIGRESHGHRRESIDRSIPCHAILKRDKERTCQLVSRQMSALCTAMAASPPIVRLNTASETALRQTPGRFCAVVCVDCVVMGSIGPAQDVCESASCACV